MSDDVREFYALVAEKYQPAINAFASSIAQNDPDAMLSLGKTMRSDALLYCQQGIMKYAITCHAKHISLHLMPIYCYADIHAKYKAIIKAGKFQKGCINFSKLDDLPMAEIGLMIAECAAKPYPTQYQLDHK